jgi:hypothetical protein
MNKWGLVSLIFAIFLLSNLFISCNVKACKDIVACGDATEGDFNLLLKVRDPSRPGLQVLCIVPEGYEYTYRYPWNGKPLESKVTHKFIGVASKGDTIPNIVKAGMILSDAGLSYGDADTDSNWVNPTRHAWDDFDWIRYACEKADDEDEAVDLLTKDAVKKMHATGVSENLFVVGPNKGVVIEADAFRYKVKEINNGVIVMSNYPKELWRTYIREKLPIARSFNTVVEKYVQNREAVRLKSLFGIRIVEIGNNFISVKPVSFIQALKTKSLGVVTKINLGERVTVGYYSVELKHIEGNRAKVRVANNYKVWEEKMLDHIQPQYGHITVKKMINWSRLHKEDLDGLRPMCQNIYEYEAVAIYKIPEQNYEIMSSGWFSPNHACSSIYVPFHICNTDIYDPYETGEAAELCLNLLKEFGHGVLDTNFTKVEEVFLIEINDAEQISIEQMENDLSISDFLTIIDTGMQKQAFLTEEIWMEAIRVPNPYTKKAIMDTIATLWDTDYANTLDRMKNALLSLEELYGVNIIKEKIVEIALDICKSRIDAANTLEKETQIAEEEYEEANKLIKQGKYNPGFDNLQKAFTRSDMLIKGQTFKNLDIVEAEKNKEGDPFLYVLIFVLIFAILALILRLRLNSQ